MKEKKHTILFSLVLLIELADSLFNFIRYFKIRENNLSVALSSLLHFIPLVALIALSKKIQKIEDKKKLSTIQKCLASYLALDVILGLVTFKFALPRYIGFLFFSKNWWFCIVYIIRYEQFHLAVDLAIDALYWLAFGFLLADISKLSDTPKEASSLENELQDTNGKQKTSPSFKIAVACMVLLVFQTALNYCAVSVWNENNYATGMQAIGLAFLFFILVAAKILFFLPVLILAIVGIVKARRSKNKPLTRNGAGLKINIACLAAGALETFFWW